MDPARGARRRGRCSVIAPGTMVALPTGADFDVRGGAEDRALAELRARIVAHVSAAAPAAPVDPDLAERRKLVSEIRTLERALPNAAVEGAIRGVAYTGIAWLALHAGRWLWRELRQPEAQP